MEKNMANLEQFQKQQYISVETFRKNGEGVKTPVWFVEFQNQLCLATGPESGKVKRHAQQPGRARGPMQNGRYGHRRMAARHHPIYARG